MKPFHGMTAATLLQIENFSQNMLLCAMTCEEIRQLFTTAQGIGMEALEWIAEAKKRCGILGRAHGWHWSVNEEVDSDLFPALEGQLSLPDTSSYPTTLTHSFFTPVFQLNRQVRLLCHRPNIQKKVVWKSNANS